MRAPTRSLLTLAALVGAAALSVGSASALSVGAAAPSALTPPDVPGGSTGGHAFTVTPGVLMAHDGPTGQHVTAIDYDLYKPDDATPQTPQPAIVMTHGFGLSKSAGEVTASAKLFASHGYVVLTWSASGFGHSGGCIALDGPDYDVKHGKQLIDLLQGKPFVAKDELGARVGIAGGSYGGGINLTLAEAEPRIRAIVPARTWNSLQYALDPNNLVMPGDATGFDHQLATQGAFKFQWTSLFFAAGNAGAAQGDGGCVPDKLQSGDPTTVAGAPCLGFVTAACAAYARLTATGDTDDAARTLVRTSSGATHIDRLRVPTLLEQGQSDTLFNLNDAMATYTALQRNGVPVALVWNSGGHGGYQSRPGEGEVYDGGSTGSQKNTDGEYLPVRTLTWFDRFLRGMAVDPGPAFAWFRDYVPNPGLAAPKAAWGTADSVTVMNATKYSLSTTNLVVGAATTGAQQMTDTGVPTSFSETSNFQAPGTTAPVGGVPFSTDPVSPTDGAGTALHFDSAPMPVDTESVGVPSAHLHLSHISPTADLTFFGKVEDVAPDGSVTLIHRLIAPVRVPASMVDQPIDLHLLGFAHLFKKDHRIRLVLATTDATSPQAAHPDVITLTTGGADPSSFSIPLRPFIAPPAVKVPRKPAKHQQGGGSPKPTVTPPGGALAATGLGIGLPLVALALVGSAAVVARRR